MRLEKPLIVLQGLQVDVEGSSGLIKQTKIEALLNGACTEIPTQSRRYSLPDRRQFCGVS